MISALIAVLGDILSDIIGGLLRDWRHDQAQRELGRSESARAQLEKTLAAERRAREIEHEMATSGIDTVLDGLHDRDRDRH